MWCLNSHARVRRLNGEHMARYGIEDGSDVAKRRMRRFGGWGGAVRAWLGEVAVMVRAKQE